MLDFKNLLKLATTTAKANPSVQTSFAFGKDQFSYEELDNTLRKELNEIAGDYNLYRENKNLVFRLFEETIDDVLPQKVIEQWGRFADVKTIPQGDKAIFVQKITAASKRRAKKFVTKVGLAGRYEVFRLDGRSFTVETAAYGGAIQLAFEEFLDGRYTWAELLDVFLESMNEVIYVEIEKALKANVTQLPTANRVIATSFVEATFDKLLTIVDSYGAKGVIYCTYEFAAKMLPLGSTASDFSRWSDGMKEDYWNNGYFPVYKGHTVIILPQSFADETNAAKVIDPRYCWILPGGDVKPVKIAFEGQTAVREVENEDWSRELQSYKKFGVATIFDANTALYIDNSLDYNGAAPITF